MFRGRKVDCAVPPVVARVIKFYNQRSGKYGCFSNFSNHHINLEGEVWSTTEHYFQAKKFLDPLIQARVRACKTPMQAKRMGSDRSLPLRKDWECVKETIMITALRAKFSQHASLQELLVSTGDALLVEHTKNDLYWADGGNGSGKNRLGHLLMQIRQELQQQRKRKLSADEAQPVSAQKRQELATIKQLLVQDEVFRAVFNEN